MSERIDDFPTGTEVVLVLFAADDSLVDGYRARFPLPFPVLVDRDRSAYRALGLGRGSWWRVWGPAALRRYRELFAEGRFGWRDLRRTEQDTRQLGGDVVVDRDGRLTYLRVGSGPDDRPPVDELVSAAELAAEPG